MLGVTKIFCYRDLTLAGESLQVPEDSPIPILQPVF